MSLVLVLLLGLVLNAKRGTLLPKLKQPFKQGIKHVDLVLVVQVNKSSNVEVLSVHQPSMWCDNSMGV